MDPLGTQMEVDVEQAQSANSASRKNFCEAEDLLLCSAWSNTTNDAIVGTDQNGDAFWKKAHAYWKTHKKDDFPERHPSGLMQRFSRIRTAVNKFCGYLAQVESLSGYTETDKAANKLVFASESGTLTNQQTTSIRMILGERNLLELSGDDHKRVRAALVSFLKPESLKQYVGKIQGEIRRHLDMHWHGKDQVTVLPLMKTLTFNIICSLLFGIEFGSRRDELISCFQTMIEGMWSVPINFPFTCYNKSLRATARAREMVRELIREKSAELEQNGIASNQDLITCLLSIRDEDGKRAISEDEIVHNIVLVMVAGHDTSSVVITFIVRLLANNPSILAGVVQEQEQIAKNKGKGESLTWEDLAMMKYTWRVAMETLRVFPPIFGGFRTASKDVEFGGYVIPQGWQVFWVTSMTHMDGNIFQEPSKFDPTRFESQAAIPPYCFVPFGGGARICPGYEFARIEILVALHHLVTQFTWTLCCKDDKFSRAPMPVPTQGLPIQITPKNVS